MLDLYIAKRCAKDIKRAAKRGKNMDKFWSIVHQLRAARNLDARYKPHPLRGEWHPCWECHIEPDWLLIYQIDGDRLKLNATGTHSDLF